MATAVLAAGATVALAAAHGGYFPSAWGWTGLVCAWAVSLGLFLRRRVVLGRVELAFLLALMALTGWTALTIAWSSSTGLSVDEVARTVSYLAGVLLVLASVRRRLVRHLLGGVLGGIALVCGYALASRLFPDHFGIGDLGLAGNRLISPLGYWNALGLFAAMGAVLAVGVAAGARRLAGRSAASAALVVLVLTLYFTFSRGAWAALAIGLGASLVLSTTRLRLATTFLAVSPAPAVAVWLGSRSNALTQRRAPLADASHDGHRLALETLLLIAVAALVPAALVLVERKLAFSQRVRRTYAVALVVAILGTSGGLLGASGGPVSAAQKLYHGFKEPLQRRLLRNGLNQRLFQVSGGGRTELWSVAWQDVEDHPVLGSGAGTFERSWLLDRKQAHNVRDAHNLYLETLAELGPLGLVLLLVALGLPLAVAFRTRGRSLSSAAFGAYAAFLVHAAFDWDWEMPAVTLVGLACGCALLVSVRASGKLLIVRTPGRRLLQGLALILGGFAFVYAIGGSARSEAADALGATEWSRAAAQARRAHAWQPWSADPWRLLGEARLGAGDTVGAAAAFRSGIQVDAGDYRLWLELGLITQGPERERALARAVALNPLLASSLEGRR